MFYEHVSGVPDFGVFVFQKGGIVKEEFLSSSLNHKEPPIKVSWRVVNFIASCQEGCYLDHRDRGPAGVSIPVCYLFFPFVPIFFDLLFDVILTLRWGVVKEKDCI